MKRITGHWKLDTGNSRGQASIETLTLLGFIVLFFVPLALLFFATSQNSSEEVAISQARLAGRMIADNAGEVYLQGAGARREAAVQFPSNLADVRVGNGEVVFTLETGKGRVDVVTTVFANVTDGSQSLHSMQGENGKINSGSRKVIFEAKQGSGKNVFVEISHG